MSEYVAEVAWRAGELATAMASGSRREDWGTSTKHCTADNQERDRMRVSAEIDERTLRGIYLSAFERVVTQAQPWTVMCSYNRLSGTYAADNRWLLTEVLKEEWGFDGLVMSDWFAVHSTVEAASSGLDLEMPGPSLWFGEKLLEAVRKGEVSEAKLDDSVRLVLGLLERAGALDAPPEVGDLSQDPAHAQLAREAAEASLVLLKNDRDVLPLDLTKVKKLAVIGPNAAAASIQGGGSAQVVPYRAVAPLDGLRVYPPTESGRLTTWIGVGGTPAWRPHGAVDAGLSDRPSRHRLAPRRPQPAAHHGPEPARLRGVVHPAPQGGQAARPDLPRRAVPDARLDDR